MPNNGSKKRAASGDVAKNTKQLKRQQRVSNDDDDSSNSSSSDNHPPRQAVPKALSPVPEETTTKLPEELLVTLYKPSGVLMIAGMVSWDLVAKRDNTEKNRDHPNLYTFHRFTDNRYRFITSSSSAGHSVLVSETGEAYTLGRNTFGQLGLGDTMKRDVPTLVPALIGKNIIHAAVGRHHTLFVTDTGTVYACGDNKFGQCGIGTIATLILLKPTRIRHVGEAPIVKVGCGTDFSMILDCNGFLHSFGLPEHGQLGHNTDGKYFVTSNKMSYSYELVPRRLDTFLEYKKGNSRHSTPLKDVVIVDFCCGNNHTVAIDSQKRVYSWGFGGFGRLGHSEQRDELMPRLIKFFDTQARRVRAIYCGSTYSLAVNELGALYMFGQNKRTGEANMYPKPVQDLAGWNVRSVGTSNTSIVIAADDNLIAWGVSPTYGELGLGEINKSTSFPRKVVRMEGINVTQVACGFSHTLLLCDDSTEEFKQKLAEKPVFEP